MRAAASEPDIAQALREFLNRELFAPAAKLLGLDDATLRLNLVGSQIVGLVIARDIVGPEPLASLPPTIVATAIAPTLQHYLAGIASVSMTR